VESVEITFLVARRDFTFAGKPLCGRPQPAIAAHDPRDTVGFNRFPSSVVADLAGHGRIVTQNAKRKTQKKNLFEFNSEY
jgi:hypothetical protein